MWYEKMIFLYFLQWHHDKQHTWPAAIPRDVGFLRSAGLLGLTGRRQKLQQIHRTTSLQTYSEPQHCIAPWTLQRITTLHPTTTGSMHHSCRLLCCVPKRGEQYATLSSKVTQHSSQAIHHNMCCKVTQHTSQVTHHHICCKVTQHTSQCHTSPHML